MARRASRIAPAGGDYQKRAGDGVRVGRGSGLRGVRGESTTGSVGVGVGALIETDLP